MSKKFLSFMACVALIVLLSACAPAFAPGVSLSVAPVNSKSDSAPAQNQPAPAQQTNPTAQPPMRTLNVTGVGTVYLTPDIATIMIGVHSENKDVTAAVNANNATVQKVKDALVKAGIDEKDIQTQNFNVYQNQKYDTQGQPTESVYAVDNTLSVTVRDISKIGKLLGTVVTSGANSINGITFDVADKTKAMSDARKLALTDAQNQANEMATALNATLGSVQTAVVNFSASPVPFAYGMGGGSVAKTAASNVPISVGQLVVTTTIQLTYEIK
jgi:uncharacterized protein YggE